MYGWKKIDEAEILPSFKRDFEYKKGNSPPLVPGAEGSYFRLTKILKGA